MPPTVSINLCCYNSEKYLRETLDSIVNQTYKDWELVIINDGSTDATETIINEYIERGFPIIYHYQNNHGLGYSRNEALKRSKGQFVAFIDHDDVWLPEKLKKQIKFFEDCSIGFVYCNAIYFSDTSDYAFNLYKMKTQPSGSIFKDLLKRYFLCLSTIVIRRDVITRLSEMFDERLHLCEEADLVLRVAYKWHAGYVNEPLCRYRMHENSSSVIRKGLYPKENLIILNKLIEMYPDLSITCKKELLYFRSIIQYLQSVNDIINNKSNNRSDIWPYILVNYRCAILWLLSLFPLGLSRRIIEIFSKYKV